MLHPMDILHNVKTGRFHPIAFRQAPMPGLVDLNAEAQRYKSLGHHTEGFETKELALENIKSDPAHMRLIEGLEYEWDETEDPTPARVEFIPKSLMIPDPNLPVEPEPESVFLEL